MGLVVAAVGLVAALQVLPEWQSVPPRRASWIQSVTQIVTEAGGRLVRPRIVFGGRGSSSEAMYERAYRRLPAKEALRFLVESGSVLGYRVTGTLEVAGAESGAVDFGLDAEGRLQLVRWTYAGPFLAMSQVDESRKKSHAAFVEKLSEALKEGPAAPGLSYTTNGVLVSTSCLTPRPGHPSESLVVMEPPGSIHLSRQLADPDAVRHLAEGGVTHFLAASLPLALLTLLVVVLFGVLLFKRRLGFRLALFLTGLAAASFLFGGMKPEIEASGPLFLAGFVLLRLGMLAFLFALWAVAESILRDTVPGFTTSLDALVGGQLGPRVGRAHLVGLGAGAAVAGWRLLAHAGAAALGAGAVRPRTPTFTVPFFSGSESPFYQGPLDAAIFVLFVALLRFGLPRRVAETSAAVAFALFVSVDGPLLPWLASFALALGVAALFLWVFQRHGFAALLITAFSAALVRDALAAARFGTEEIVPCAVSTLTLAALAIVGFVSLHRPEREDESKVAAPEYVRRLESERRVKYEMDLLSRMQLALLPEKAPHIPGLDLGVSTLLATEAGGDLYDFVSDGGGALWIAAGDVSGHGYSCGIQQAMVKAALVSLVKEGCSPAQILWDVDRVLRTGRGARLFTTLSLLKLDPKTGRGVLANAGHPFPLLLVEGSCTEIAVPGLPLGQGPARTYEDVEIQIPEGGVLVIASDGLYEGPDRFDEPYGYARPTQLLQGVGLWRRPADAIIEALFADWRRHVGEGAPADDTTILVVRRPALTW